MHIWWKQLTEKRVNVKIQMLATLFIPTGLFAFRRIKRGRYGIAVYILTIGLPFIFGLLVEPPMPDCDYFRGITYCEPDPNMVSYSVAILVLVLQSFILPMLFIQHWSSAWNKNLIKFDANNKHAKSRSVQETQAEPRSEK